MDDVSQLTSGADQEYFQGLKDGEVRLQFCAGCERPHWPAVFRCPDCGSWDHEWKAVAPKGTIYSWTRTHHAFGGLQAFDLPFISVVVSLGEFSSVRLLGLLSDAQADVRIGAKVVGQVSKVAFGGQNIPALSWSIDDRSV